MHGQQGIEEIGQVDAVGLGDQSEQRPVAVETPGNADRGNLDTGLTVTVEDLVAEAASGVAVGEGDGYIAVPLHIHYCNESIREDALHCCSPGQLLQLCHRSRTPFQAELI